MAAGCGGVVGAPAITIDGCKLACATKMVNESGSADVLTPAAGEIEGGQHG